MGNSLSCWRPRRSGKPRILFLTTQPPDQIKAEWPFYQNWFLPDVIRQRGGNVDIRCWRDGALTAASIAEYDTVSFLWCNDYHAHPKDFPDFVRNVIIPAQTLNAHIRIVNDSGTVLWNCDKHYLLEMMNAGFAVPKLQFLDSTTLSRASLTSAVQRFSTARPVVLKPAISGSARKTHLIRNPQAFSLEDQKFIGDVVADGVNGDLILQEYEEAILAGEYSLIFINGRHTHTILKIPHGDYRCQGEYGGSTEEIALLDVPPDAFRVARDIVRYIGSKVADGVHYQDKEDGALPYARIDGVMKDGRFLLMEVEAIEPHLWLEAESGAIALEELCKTLLN